MKNMHILGAILALVIVGGGAFYGGMAYAKSSTPARGAIGAGFAGAGGAGRTGARAGGGFTAGTVISSGNGSITIQEAQGGSTEIVLVSSSTQILKSTAGSLSDLAQGTNVTVTGTSNSDGSLTANAIQIRPAGMGAPTRTP